MTDHPWKYQDPNKSPSRKGLLLSNEIERFCNVGLLIERESYKPEMVKPASYTLTIGPDYVDSDGKIRKMSKKKDYFIMEPNSIVYVSTSEKLNLPFYIAARFNLRVTWVYKGILLGTGPQVDPGFRGNLSCPLFNLTNRSIRIKLGEAFATIDFERTSDFCGDEPWETVKGTFKVGEDQDEVFANGERFLLFKQKPFSPLKKLPDNEVISSLVQLSQDVKTWRNIGIAAVIAFLSLALTLLNFQNNLYRDNKALSDQISGFRERLSAVETRLKQAEGAANKATAIPEKSPKIKGKNSSGS